MIIFYQSLYKAKVLKCFYIAIAHPLALYIVIRSVDVNRDPFHPIEYGKKDS